MINSTSFVTELPSTGKYNSNISNKQFGFSLIELMIAITVGLIMLVALGALCLSITNSNKEMAKTNAQIENGRFAMQLLQDDIVHAGFWGDYVPRFDDLTATGAPGDVPTAVPDICLAYSATNWDSTYKNNLIGIPIQAYDAVPTSCNTLLTDKKASTDVLVVRHVNTCVTDATGCETNTSGKLYFQSSECQAPLPASMTADVSGYLLDTTNLNTLHKKNCTTVVTDTRRFISNIYYVRTYSNSSGDGVPTLMRSQFDLNGGALGHQAAIPLIEGIEGFNVELGIDNKSDTGATVNYAQAVSWANPKNLTSPTNRGDGNPDSFITCTTASPCTVNQLINTVAVRIYVLARANETTPGYSDAKTYSLGGVTLGPYNDAYKRHVFSTTVRLQNISTRRETP